MTNIPVHYACQVFSPKLTQQILKKRSCEWCACHESDQEGGKASEALRTLVDTVNSRVCSETRPMPPLPLKNSET